MTLDEYLTSSPEVQSNLRLRYIETLKDEIVRLKAQIEKAEAFVNKLEGKSVEEIPNKEI